MVLGTGRLDLLVAAAKKGDRGEVVETDVLQCLQRKQPGQQPAFHVARTRADSPPIRNAERPFGRGAVRVHRVKVAGDEDVRLTAAV